jgi:uncharacterized protein
MEEKLREDLKSALLLGNEITVSTIRLLLSEMRNAQIKKGEALTDEEVVSLIQKEIKKRKEAAELFKTGYREELAEKEEAEASVLQTYLPEQISQRELEGIVSQTIEELGAKGMQDMGRVIGVVRSKVGQGAEGSVISQIVKSKLL